VENGQGLPPIVLVLSPEAIRVNPVKVQGAQTSQIPQDRAAWGG